MPITAYQSKLGILLSKNRSEDSYLAGGTAILSEPNTVRYSQDMDYFHDSEERVASAFESDEKILKANNFKIEIEITQPGYIRAIVSKGKNFTKIEWAQDSSWRFMPVIKSDTFGFQLHPIDLATNKVLALAGRNEVRDLIDTLYFDEYLLGLGPLVWAAVGKDPGFSPLSLLELLKRRGKIQPNDLNKLKLKKKLDVSKIKGDWIQALEDAKDFIRERPNNEVGCLYWGKKSKVFVNPITSKEDYLCHYGKPGGVLPNIKS